MPVCSECGDEVAELVRARIGDRPKRVCEACADRAREEAEIAEQSEAEVQRMMDFKGRR